MPIPAALPQLPNVAVSAEEAGRLRNGLRIPVAGEALAVDGAGQAVAILREGQPKIVFGVES
jgi:hypothetical protein